MFYTGLIVCITGSLLLIFRAHYYHGWINIAAMLCSVVPFLVWFDTFINQFTKRINSQGARRFVNKIVTFPVLLFWLYCGYRIHIGYQHYAISKYTEYVTATIEKEDFGSYSGRPQKYFIYYYAYNNSRYCNEMEAAGSGYSVGDRFQLEISKFDPTVTNLN